MKTKTILCSLFALLISTTQAIDLGAETPDAIQPQQESTAQHSAAQQPAEQTPAPSLLRDLPRELRMHLPMLANDQGCWVDVVPARSAAERIGLLHGDLLIEINGQKALAGIADEVLYHLNSAVVLRRGRRLSLPIQPHPGVGQPDRLPQWMWDRLPPEARHAAAGMAPPQIPITNWNHFGRVPVAQNQGTAIARSTAVGSQAIAVSRAGNQLSLDMTVKALGGKRIHLSGELETIRNDVEQSNLSDEAKREILDVVNAQG